MSPSANQQDEQNVPASHEDDNENLKQVPESSQGGEMAAMQASRVAEFASTFRIWRFIDPREPWVLVENGSLLGFFDWVPEKCRAGPWSMTAICWLTVCAKLAVWPCCDPSQWYRLCSQLIRFSLFGHRDSSTWWDFQWQSCLVRLVALYGQQNFLI